MNVVYVSLYTATVPLHDKEVLHRQPTNNSNERKEHLIMGAVAHVVEDFSLSSQKNYLYLSCLGQEWRKGSYL